MTTYEIKLTWKQDIRVLEADNEDEAEKYYRKNILPNLQFPEEYDLEIEEVEE